MTFHEPSQAEVALTRFFMTFIQGPFYKKYVADMELKGDESVLEFGPGSGKMSRYLAESLPDGRLTIVDLSKAWLGLIRKKLMKYPNVDLKQGKIMDLPIADGSYDVVVASFVIHDVDEDERQRVVDTLAGKLKSGGRMFVRDPEVSGRNGHGITGADLRSVMRNSGLNELSFKRLKPFYMGPMNEGVYIKE
ncbi:MAG TPA: class I SAM-dependent methyltransferase [Methanocella sp.]|nr:class I SAM-dependent methyltransferase [Methanocella sp.]